MEKFKLKVGDLGTTELSKPTDPQTSSNTLENSRDNVDEGQGVSANKPDTASISSSEMQSEKTSKDTNEVVAKPENIGKYNLLKTWQGYGKQNILSGKLIPLILHFELNNWQIIFAIANTVCHFLMSFINKWNDYYHEQAMIARCDTTCLLAR